MPPVPGQANIPSWNPRVVCYYQTYHHDGQYTSLLPLITNPSGVTHVILAAIHINSVPKDLTLNDHPPSHEMYTELWDEVVVLQDSGVKVLGMLGGAAKGSYIRLDWSESRTDIPIHRFEAYYAPLRDMIRRYNLDGLDLDIEEEMSLPGVVHLIDRLKADFGRDFLITLAPVANALVGGRHLSGFDYSALESLRGSSIAWYNAQFYNGWGFMFNTFGYDQVINFGFQPEKVVVGLLTNPIHGGSGYVPFEILAPVLSLLMEKYPRFGGVMGWEYWNALPDSQDPWVWAWAISLCLGMKRMRDAAVIVNMGRSLSAVNLQRT